MWLCLATLDCLITPLKTRLTLLWLSSSWKGHLHLFSQLLCFQAYQPWRTPEKWLLAFQKRHLAKKMSLQLQLTGNRTDVVWQQVPKPLMERLTLICAQMWLEIQQHWALMGRQLFFCFLNFWILFYLFFIQQVPISHPFHTHQCIHVNPNRPIHPTTTHPPPLPPLGVHTFVLYICVSISALQTGSSVPFF